MNDDRAQLEKLGEHLAAREPVRDPYKLTPAGVAARADRRTRIRRDVLARLLGPVRVPRPDQE